MKVLRSISVASVLAILGTSFFAMAHVASAETMFDRVESVYDDAVNINVRNFAQEQAWAGRCYHRGAPDTAVPGLFNTHQVGRNSDPLIEPELYFTMMGYTAGGDFFLNASREEIAGYHRDDRDSLGIEWTPPARMSGPILTEYRFKWRGFDDQGDAILGSDYAVRRAVSSDGEPFYVLKALCPTDVACRSEFDPGVSYAMCYVWDEKLGG